jgi:hypothetical protein
LKYILGIVLLLIVTTVYFVTRPQPGFEAGKMTAVTEPAETEAAEETLQPDPETIAMHQKRQAMEAEFAKLEKARRNLESRLGRLKAILWGEEIPKVESDAISDEMKNGYLLLKNKKLMGAYADVSAITDEYSRIEFINENLKKIEEKYREQRIGDN